jgi:hypothetical protein
VTFRRNLLPPSSGCLNVSEEDDQVIGREELVGYTGNANVILAFQSSDLPKFPPISYTLDKRLPLPSALT